MLEELKDDSYQQMKEERKTARTGDVMCIGPVDRQNTYDNDDSNRLEELSKNNTIKLNNDFRPIFC